MTNVSADQSQVNPLKREPYTSCEATFSNTFCVGFGTVFREELQTTEATHALLQAIRL